MAPEMDHPQTSELSIGHMLVHPFATQLVGSDEIRSPIWNESQTTPCSKAHAKPQN